MEILYSLGLRFVWDYNILLFVIRAIAILLSVLTAFPLCAALGPGPEIPVSPAAVASITGPHETAGLATDGKDFLSLWYDSTDGRDGIYATILTESGTTRPAVPRPLMRGRAGISAVWTGNSYLVALTRYMKPSLLVRLDRDGEIVSPLRSLDLGDNRNVYGLAWNGERVLAIISGPAGYSVALLDAEGNVVRSGIELPAGIQWFTVSTAGEVFILVWTEQLVPQNGATPPQMRVRAARISDEGNVSAPVELLAPEQAYVEVISASGAAEAGVVVVIQSITGTVTIRRYVIDSTVIDAEVPLRLEPFVVNGPGVVATSRGFVVTYLAIVEGKTLQYELRTIEFGSSTYRSIELPPSSGLWSARSNGSSVMAVWGTYPLRAAAFDAALTHRTSAIFPIPTAPAQQSLPTIASAGSTGVIAWVEHGTLKVRRIDRDGTVLDAEPLVLGTAAYRPVVVFTGQVWLIAWVEPGDIQSGPVKVRRISPEGVPLGDAATLDLPAGDLAVASNGSVTVLAVSSHQTGQGIRLVRFSANGDRIDANPIVLSDTRVNDHPAIASNGQEFLVAWRETLGRTPHVHAKRLDAAGNPIDAEPFAIANRSDRSQSAAQIASNGDGYIVTYAQTGVVMIIDPPLPNPPAPEPSRVFTKRVLATGVLAGSTADQDGTFIAFGTFPAIVADGSRYVATYVRQDFDTLARFEAPDTLALFAVPLDESGEPTAAPRLLVFRESYGQDHGIARIGGALWTTYSRVVPELASVHRVFLREVTEQQGRHRGLRP